MRTLGLIAYIDPGTGALVFQVLIATLLSAGILFRRVLAAPLRFFLRSITPRRSDAASPHIDGVNDD